MGRTFDAIVVGAGQAGTPLAVRLAQAGRKTLLVEREHVGGTCVNDGCTPTKAMVASARAAHVARHAADFGVSAGPVTVDMAAVKARKDTIVQASVDSLGAWIAGTDGLTYLRGHARFTGPRALEIGGESFSADAVFLNTGGRAVVPDWPGLADVPFLTNATIMDLAVLPDHLVIAGGSYIGLEFAQVFRRFGARVTVLEHGGRLIGREDADVSEAVRAILDGEGIVVRTGVRDIAVRRAGGDIRLDFTVDGEKHHAEGSHLLLAVGRRPNTDDLGLDAAGIATDDKGFVTVDDELRTSADGVWALGDVNGRGAFTHTSYNDFEIVAGNLLDGESRRVGDRIPVYGLFIDPPLGRVGLTEAQVRAGGRPALMGVMPMSRIGRARERGETTGFIKILADAESTGLPRIRPLGIDHIRIDTKNQSVAPPPDLPRLAIRRLLDEHDRIRRQFLKQVLVEAADDHAERERKKLHQVAATRRRRGQIQRLRRRRTRLRDRVVLIGHAGLLGRNAAARHAALLPRLLKTSHRLPGFIGDFPASRLHRQLDLLGRLGAQDRGRFRVGRLLSGFPLGLFFPTCFLVGLRDRVGGVSQCRVRGSHRAVGQIRGEGRRFRRCL